MKLICSSCGTDVTGQDSFARFKCPNCGEGIIVRCTKCRKLSNPYKCVVCNFEGP